MNFTYSIEKKTGVNVVTLTGELIDKGQAEVMLNELYALIENKEVRFVLCLSDLKYINSSGLGVLINILTRSRKAGGDVAISGISKKVNELLIITKLNHIFNVSDSMDEAIRSIDKK